MLLKNDFILNVDICTTTRFSPEYFESFKSQMEKEFGFNEFHIILLENCDISSSGIIEIYIEDLDIEFDLTEEIESILPFLDQHLPTIEKGSRIEWYSPRGLCNYLWEKEDGGWEKSEENDSMDFYDEDPFLDFDYD